MERIATSFRKMYEKVVKEVGPKGNPECPAYVRLAKKCDREIFQKAEIKLGMTLMNLLWKFQPPI